MKRPLWFFLIILLCFSSGCGWFSKKQTLSGLPKGPSETPPLARRYVDTGRIFDKDTLKAGGTLLLVPFSAGNNVEADDQMDKVALMIIRGLYDVFEPETSDPEIKPTPKFPIDIVFSENEGDPDFILDGHITAIEEKNGVGVWFFKSHRVMLQVEGKLVQRSDNRVILFFKDRITSTAKNENLNFLGLKVGQNIGKFMASTITDQEI